MLGNIERTSNLYVTKTVYAMLIALGSAWWASSSRSFRGS